MSFIRRARLVAFDVSRLTQESKSCERGDQRLRIAAEADQTRSRTVASNRVPAHYPHLTRDIWQSQSCCDRMLGRCSFGTGELLFHAITLEFKRSCPNFLEECF